MDQRPILSTCVVPPSGGKVMRAFGDEITVHLGAAETGGKYTMFTAVTPPGGGPPPHYHANEDEWFFVLEGRAEFFKDNVWAEVPIGAAVFTPTGVVHAFRNPGDKPLRMVVHTAPSGFEVFFARCAEEFAKPAHPTCLAWSRSLVNTESTSSIREPVVPMPGLIDGRWTTPRQESPEPSEKKVQ